MENLVNLIFMFEALSSSRPLLYHMSECVYFRNAKNMPALEYIDNITNCIVFLHARCHKRMSVCLHTDINAY